MLVVDGSSLRRCSHAKKAIACLHPPKTKEMRKQKSYRKNQVPKCRSLNLNK